MVYTRRALPTYRLPRLWQFDKQRIWIFSRFWSHGRFRRGRWCVRVAVSSCPSSNRPLSIFSSFRWLFFIEGGLTILVALWSMSILPDFPESKTTLSWLTLGERKLALRRMAEDAETSCKFSQTGFRSLSSLRLVNRWPGLHEALTDSKVWWLALTLTVMVASLSFSAYFPTIVGTLMVGLGYRSNENVMAVLLLCVPPWVCATGLAILVSRLVSLSLSLSLVGWIDS